ncbi:hypothetical protein ACIRRH_15425 [Kitasatospora sp. NPDC101235]|uniref:hypothetical protein n=1 Tax=Kitasatospora sp. NPDC101235 TaxID=3364101 RepID=UPI00382A0BA4
MELQAHQALGEVIAAAAPEKTTESAGSAVAEAPAKTPGPDTDELFDRFANLMAAKYGLTASSTEQTTPNLREAPQRAAKDDVASLRLRTDLNALALEVFTLTD